MFFYVIFFFFFSSRRRHTRCLSDWSSDVCSSDLMIVMAIMIVIAVTAAMTVMAVIIVMIAAIIMIVIAVSSAAVDEIGRASCRKECRSRWSQVYYRRKDEIRV